LPDTKEKKPFSLQDHVEWIAVAFVLALTVRCFILQAYQIPTGSMAPTLYGEHYRVTCPCGAQFNLRSNGNGPADLDITCPACGRNLDNAPVRLESRGGDRILVSMNVYLFSRPQRWDVFVFKSPENEQHSMNFVKRLAGLPGETVTIKNGQLFIDGKIARKPPEVQREVWQSVYNRYSARNAQDYWRPSRSWRVTDEGLLLAEGTTGWQTIEYDRRILDFYAYNGRRGLNQVGDLRVSGTAVIEREEGELTAALWANDQTYRAIYTLGKAEVLVRLQSTEGMEARGRAYVSPTGEFDFSFSRADGRLAASVNGREVASLSRPLSVADVPKYTHGSGVFFQGAGSRMLLKDVSIQRDIYYRSDLTRADRAVRAPLVAKVPEGYYFGLGDNSPISNDSREWGLIPEENVLGKAFFVFWPLTRLGPVY